MPESPAQPDPKEAVEARLCAYLDGELSVEERAEIERHLAQNPPHRLLLADLAQTRQWLRDLPREPAPPEIGDAYQQQVERSLLLGDGEVVPRRGGRWPQRVLLAAMVSVAVGLGVVLTVMLSGPKTRPVGRLAVDVPARAPVPTDRLADAPRATTSPAVQDAMAPLADSQGQRLRSDHQAAAAPAGNVGGLSSAAMPSQYGLAQVPPAAEPQSTPRAADKVVVVPATVQLAVTTADADGVDARIRGFLGRAHLSLDDVPTPVVVAAANGYGGSAAPAAAGGGGRPSLAQRRVAAAPLTPAAAAEANALRDDAPGAPTVDNAASNLANNAGNGPANAAVPSSRHYVVRGLTAEQVRQLTADLSAVAALDHVVTTPAAVGFATAKDRPASTFASRAGSVPATAPAGPVGRAVPATTQSSGGTTVVIDVRTRDLRTRTSGPDAAP